MMATTYSLTSDCVSSPMRWTFPGQQILTAKGWLRILGKQDMFPGVVYVLTDCGWLRYHPGDEVRVRP